jgi:type VI protein secretion system component Hcp
MAKNFLKLGNVMGSSTDPGHVQWIELLSCSFPLRPGERAAPVRPPPGSNAKPQIELQCSKSFDVSSGALLQMANDGAVVDSATVEFLSDQGAAHLSLFLSDVRLTSCSTRQGPSDSVMEIFGLMCVVESTYPDNSLPKTNEPTVFWVGRGRQLKIE